MQIGQGPGLRYETTGKKVFRTSTLGSGKFELWSGATGTGIAAGDSICNARAAAAGLAGSYKAWLSDSSTDAAARLLSSGPWIRVDGVKLADNKADLTDGTLMTAVLDEFGTSDFTYVWTGTSGGTKASDTCADWTDDTSSTFGMYGYTVYERLWSDWGSRTCDQPSALYCFED